MDEKTKSSLEKLITESASAINSFFAMNREARTFPLRDDLHIIKIDEDNYYLTYKTLGKGAQGAVYQARPLRSFDDIPIQLEDKDVAIKINDYSEQGFASGRDINASIAKGQKQNELLTKIGVSEGYTLNKQHRKVMIEQIDGSMVEKDKLVQEGISVMPLYSGPDLSKKAHKNSFSYGSFSQVSMAMQLINEVNDLHSKNIIHKDIKPANVLWDTKTGAVKLVDFDSATPVTSDKETIQTSESSDKDYMAPESLESKRGYLFSKSSDIYSVGKVLAEKIGLQGKTHLSYIDILIKNQINKMLTKEPSQRPTMQECHSFFSKIHKMNENMITYPENKLRLNLGKQLVNLEIYFNQNKHHEQQDKSFAQKLKLRANKKGKLAVIKETISVITEALAEEPINTQKLETDIKKLSSQEHAAQGVFSSRGEVQKILSDITESVREANKDTPAPKIPR